MEITIRNIIWYNNFPILTKNDYGHLEVKFTVQYRDLLIHILLIHILLFCLDDLNAAGSLYLLWYLAELDVINKIWIVL